MATLWLKIGDSDEFNAEDITVGLKFLGADSNPV